MKTKQALEDLKKKPGAKERVLDQGTTWRF
jgi:hypothetical protein